MRRSLSLRLTVFAALFMLVMAGCSKVTGNYFAPTAAVVCLPNTRCTPIKESELAPQFQAVLRDPNAAAQFRGPTGAANRLDAQRKVLTDQIISALIKSEARRADIEATPEEVEKSLAQVRSRFPAQGQFKEALKQQGLTLPELRTYLGDQLVFTKLAGAVVKVPNPTDQQLQQAYDQSKAQYDAQFKAAHVLVCTNFDPSNGSCGLTPDDEALAGSVATRARAGEDFAALAKEFSKDTGTAQKGGELGFVGKGQLVAEFEQALYGLAAPGQISDPVKSRFGWHVIKLLAKGKSFEDAKPEISKSLLEKGQEEAFKVWIGKIAGQAKVTVNSKFGRFDRTSREVVPLKPVIAPRGAASPMPPQQQAPANQPPPPQPQAPANQPPAQQP